MIEQLKIWFRLNLSYVGKDRKLYRVAAFSVNENDQEKQTKKKSRK